MSTGPTNAAHDTTGATVVMQTQTQALTVGAADTQLGTVFNCGFCRRVYCNGPGTLFVQRALDAAPVAYTVVAGTQIDGRIVLIGGQTNHPTASALSLVLEA